MYRHNSIKSSKFSQERHVFFLFLHVYLQSMKIAVLVSGGVDSSVALALLKQQGHQVTAFYLKIWLEDELAFMGTCPWQEDLAYVREVCDQAQVSLEVVSLQKEYWDHVVAYTIAEIKKGNTPNPDVLCNSRIKFGFFADYLMRHHPQYFDKIASGHYAQVREDSGNARLMCAVDPIKDQTYFLSYLTQQQVSKLLFPIGHLHKAQVREAATLLNLPNKDRKDSQGICFLGKISFRDFIAYHVGEKIGDFVSHETGKKVGQHKGFWFYTIGQRQNIGLSGGPWYVVAKDPDSNTVFISCAYHDQDKKRDQFIVGSCSWITESQPTDDTLMIKLRHGKEFHQASVVYRADQTLEVRLCNRDQGIAPGQFAVFYKNGECLGSGTITQTLNEQ